MDKAVCENEYQPRGDVLQTPSEVSWLEENTLHLFLSNVNISPLRAFLA